ncbi:MAG: hypothetical protein C0456_18950 [Hyphomonas sp.]|uniref:hypothetical protein n=1 Tax=Hyphomonas sp. TaxID=87 RepID=UPI001DB4EF6F|nr:hypothetical protein [Hyphomonas sp.]MBA4228687.1 hypothetical protein [Hyphomonas sp.]
MGWISYLKTRLREASSWASIVASITAASVLEFPWDIAAAIAGVIGVLVPEQSNKKEATSTDEVASDV